MSAFLQDLRHTARLLTHAPGFSVVVILTLGLGIGANTALFSVMDAVWLRALPYPNADRLVAVWNSTGQSSRVLPSSADFETWRQYDEVFQETFGIAAANARVTIGSESLEANVARVQSQLFASLGERPLLGRLLTDADEQSGAPAVALVSQRFWQQQFGSDPGIIGRTIQVGPSSLGAGTPEGRRSQDTAVIVGVLPAHFSKLVFSALVLPPATATAVDPRSRRPLRVMGLLQPGIGVAEAQAMVDARPRTNPMWRPVVVSLRDSIVGAEVGRVLTLLFAATGLVLLIACANVANLLLARMAGREREIAVRTALGADRWRLGRQLLTESLVLSAVGAGVGLLLARITRPLLISLIPARTPGLDAIAIDLRVLAFTMFAAAGTALVAGLWPIARLSRSRAERVLAGRAAAGVTSVSTSRALLAMEIGLALAVIVAAGVLVRSFVRLVNVDAGFKPDGIVTFRTVPVSPPSSLRGVTGLRDIRNRAQLDIWNAAQLEHGKRVLEDVRRLRSVQAVGGISRLPLGIVGLATYTIRLEGRELGEHEDPWVQYHLATPGYFEVMGIPLRWGRRFTDADRDGAPGVVIVNELAARRFWPGQDAIGQRVFLGSNEPLTVIGIVGNVRQASLATEPQAEVYRSWLQEPASLTYAVRTSDPGLLRLLSAPGATIGDTRVTDVETLDDHVMSTVQEPRARMLLFTLAGGLVLLLTMVGVAGLTAHAVSRRAREVGIRIALGARPSQILMLMMGQSAVPLAAGIAIGALAAWWASTFLESFLFEIPARDPPTLIASAALLVMSTLAATWLPARRATRLEPAITLRTE